MLSEKAKKVLENLEKTREEFWNIPREVAEFLFLLILDRGYKTVLEIGTSNGYSGIWLAEALRNVNGKLYTIESNYKKRFPLSQANFQEAGVTEYIEQILGHAPEDIPTEPKTFDLAFFDATKKEHLKFFNALKSRINPGGVIISDNIISHQEAMKPYIDAAHAEPGWHSEILNLGQGIMLSWKK